MGNTRFNSFIQFNSATLPNIVTPTTVTGTNTYNSAITDINQQHNVGLDVRFVGTMAGTLTVNCSNDGVVFTALTFNPAITQPSGSSLNFLVNLNNLPFRYVQVSYTNSTGSGTLISYLTSKDLD
jgi:hypothetical protein